MKTSGLIFPRMFIQIYMLNYLYESNYRIAATRHYLNRISYIPIIQLNSGIHYVDTLHSILSPKNIFKLKTILTFEIMCTTDKLS